MQKQLFTKRNIERINGHQKPFSYSCHICDTELWLSMETLGLNSGRRDFFGHAHTGGKP